MLDSQPDGWNGAEALVGCAAPTPDYRWHYCSKTRKAAPGPQSGCCDVPAIVSAPTRTILDDAARLTSSDRQKVYGHPRENFGQTAELWSAILGAKVTAEQVALCMIAAKVSRLCKTPDHRDSWVDIAGYARTGEMLNE